MRKYTNNEIDAAKHVLNIYRQTFPSIDDIEDEVIVADIYRCKEILSSIDVSTDEIFNSNITKKESKAPWFLKGPKSQQFKLQLEECIKQGAYGEVNELREEISRMKNKYARERYTKIYEYVMSHQF